MQRPRWTVISLLLFLLLELATSLHAQWNPLNPIEGVQKQADGLLFTTQAGVLRVQACTESIIHVLHSPTSSFPNRLDYVVTKTSWPATQWTMQATDRDITLATSRLKVTVSRKDGVIVFSDAAGKRLMQDSSRTMTPVVVNG